MRIQSVVIGSAVLTLLVWAGAIRAETLDEAVARLAKAGDAVNDLTLTFTSTQGTTKEASQLWMLKQDGKRLVRCVRKQATLLGGIPGTMEIVEALDGQSFWRQSKGGGATNSVVTRHKLADGPRAARAELGFYALGLGAAQGDFLGAVAELAGMFTVKLVGPGQALGRPTTTVEIAVKPELLARVSDEEKKLLPGRTVVQYDNATGVQLALKSVDAAGQPASDWQATALQVNTGLAPELFRYTPPQDATMVK